jgi:hypothetical protein
MINIDYKKLHQLHKEKQGEQSWSIALLKHIPIIGALRQLKWTHREIVAILIESDTDLARLHTTKPLGNNSLCALISKWNTKGIMQAKAKEIALEVGKIQSLKTEKEIEEELEKDFFKV